jgi:hypothetical protein
MRYARFLFLLVPAAIILPTPSSPTPRRPSRSQARRSRATAEELREADTGTGSLSDISEDVLCGHADFLRTALEVLNVALASALPANPHLVYAVLERQQIFEPLRQHALFWDLIDNVFLVIDHFGAGLHGHAGHESDGAAGPGGMQSTAGGSGSAAGTAAERHGDPFAGPRRGPCPERRC